MSDIFFVYFFLILHLYVVALIWLSISSFSLHVINISHKLNTPLKIISGQYFENMRSISKTSQEKMSKMFSIHVSVQSVHQPVVCE